MVNCCRSTARTSRSVEIMIIEGSYAPEDGMTPMPTQRLLLPQRQPRVPRPGPHPLVPFARGGGVGGGGVPAWRGTPPAPAPARATAGIARASALADAWDTGIAAPAHPINTADPPAAGAPPVVSPLACGADLLRGIRAHGTGGPLVLGLDASHRRADVVLLRMSVR